MKVKNFTVKLLLLMIFSLLITSCGKDFDAWKELKNCPGMPSFMYEGQFYNTVQIGTQCWIAENLNIGEQISGSVEMTDNGRIEKYCYDNNPENCDVYGGLYQWDEIVKYNENPLAGDICPPGWHVPTPEDWLNISQFLGNDAGGKMKQSGTSFWEGSNYGATNLSGFTALPAGHRNSQGTFDKLGQSAFFWSSDKYQAKELYYGNNDLSNDNNKVSDGFNIRCVNTPQSPVIKTYSPDGTNNFPLEGTLIWGGCDRNGDILTYSVYFGEANQPDVFPMVAEGISDTTFFVESLKLNTMYHWKVSANDGNSSTWSDTLYFRTYPAPCADVPELLYEGKLYHTVQVGNQCWMRENLDIGTMIPNGTLPANNGVIEKYCYKNDNANCEIYGGFYKLLEMVQYVYAPESQGICPSGWHIPSNDDWHALLEYLGDDEEGGKMKAIGTDHWKSPNAGSTNESGLCFLPGNIDPSSWSDYTEFNEQATLWSSTFGGIGYIQTINMFCLAYNNNVVYHYEWGQGWSIGGPEYSVRCIKDSTDK